MKSACNSCRAVHVQGDWKRCTARRAPRDEIRLSSLGPCDLLISAMRRVERYQTFYIWREKWHAYFLVLSQSTILVNTCVFTCYRTAVWTFFLHFTFYIKCTFYIFTFFYTPIPPIALSLMTYRGTSNGADIDSINSASSADDLQLQVQGYLEIEWRW